MEGRNSNFKEVFSNFLLDIKAALFVVVDMEFSGVTAHQQPDNYSEDAHTRLSKMCRIAEDHTPIQIGITLVSLVNGDRHHYKLASYNFYMFPWADRETGHDPSFLCKASALQFLCKTSATDSTPPVDFNAWIRDGVRYMSREDEKAYLAGSGANDAELPDKTGLLQLWKALCDAQVPLVFHGPLDLFFLLAKFERGHLPDDDPRALAQLVLDCFPVVFDTSHLHGAFGDMGRLNLERWHDSLVRNGSMAAVTFDLAPETEARYGGGQKRLHEAGYDSFLTAQVFACLLSIDKNMVWEGRNRLFLHKSLEYLDLGRAAKGDEIGACIFDASREQPLVARFEKPVDQAMLNNIRAHGFSYRKMDRKHIAVVCPATGKDATDRFAQLAHTVHGVESWLELHVWRMQAQISMDSFSDGDSEASTTTQTQNSFDRFSDGASVASTASEEVDFFVGTSDLRNPSNTSLAMKQSCSIGSEQNASASGGGGSTGAAEWLVPSQTSPANCSSCSSQGCCADSSDSSSEAAVLHSPIRTTHWLTPPGSSEAEASDRDSGCACAQATECRAPSSIVAAAGTPCAQQYFRGVLKVFYPEKGYGFIVCPETYHLYKYDVFVHHLQVNNATQGQVVTFALTFNSKGQPQAHNVRCLDHDNACTPPYSVQRMGDSPFSQLPSTTVSGDRWEGVLLTKLADGDEQAVPEADAPSTTVPSDDSSWAHSDLGSLHEEETAMAHKLFHKNKIRR